MAISHMKEPGSRELSEHVPEKHGLACGLTPGIFPVIGAEWTTAAFGICVGKSSRMNPLAGNSLRIVYRDMDFWTGVFSLI
jgi:hypothetical protein